MGKDVPREGTKAFPIGTRQDGIGVPTGIRVVDSGTAMGSRRDYNGRLAELTPSVIGPEHPLFIGPKVPQGLILDEVSTEEVPSPDEEEEGKPIFLAIEDSRKVRSKSKGGALGTAAIRRFRAEERESAEKAALAKEREETYRRIISHRSDNQAAVFNAELDQWASVIFAAFLKARREEVFAATRKVALSNKDAGDV